MNHPLIVTSRAQANKIAVGPAPGWREQAGCVLQLLLNVVLLIVVGAALAPASLLLGRGVTPSAPPSSGHVMVTGIHPSGVGRMKW
jgi:hypothetical protein